jgi:hypothetical protein
VADSAGNPVAAIETTAMRVIGRGDVDLAHALGEGKGYTSVAEMAGGHEQFWHSQQMREALGDPEFTVDDTLVVAQVFRLQAARSITEYRPAGQRAGCPLEVRARARQRAPAREICRS